jgi:hypothetical protein
MPLVWCTNHKIHHVSPLPTYKELQLLPVIILTAIEQQNMETRLNRTETCGLARRSTLR